MPITEILPRDIAVPVAHPLHSPGARVQLRCCLTLITAGKSEEAV
jgi:hypothetical protein